MFGVVHTRPNYYVGINLFVYLSNYIYFKSVPNVFSLSLLLTLFLFVSLSLAPSSFPDVRVALACLFHQAARAMFNYGIL